MAEKEVVRFDVSMDNPHGVDQFDQTKQLGGQIDGNWLNDAPGKVKVIASRYRIHVELNDTHLSEFLVRFTKSSKVPIR